MQNRVILITGANGSLGRSVTEHFLANGDTVLGTARHIESSDFNHNNNFTAIEADFTDSRSVENLTATITRNFQRVDVCVHAMGGFAGGKPVHETGEATWSQMYEFNLNSAFRLARAVIPIMRKNNGGRFIAVGSKTAERAHASLGAYVVFKSALVTLIQTLALENWDANIAVNAVLPATMDTPANRAAMPSVDPAKWLKTSEVADLIFWLASDAAASVNGAAIPIGT